MQNPEAHARIAEWYAANLRPKLAQAAQEGRVEPLQAIALERAMADLVGRDRAWPGRPGDRVREAALR